MNRIQLITPVLTLALASSALASGSAPTRPPRPPRANAPAETMDNSKYALGKSVFTGKARPYSNPSAARQQKARLAQLAAETGESGASLPKLAGKLSAEQLDALEYYISKRYGTN